jgi:hypothetical protein
MSDSQQPPQPAAGGQMQLLRADDIIKLQCLPDDEKQKYRQVMKSAWDMMGAHQPGTTEHTNARQKLAEWSAKLIQRERMHRNAKARAAEQQRQQGTQAQAGPASQTAVKQEQPQALQRVAEGVSIPQQSQPQQPTGAPRPTAAPSVDPAIVKHVQDFPIMVPPNGPLPDTPEYNAKVKEYRSGYLNMLVKSSSLASHAKRLQETYELRTKDGGEAGDDVLNMKTRVEKEYETMSEQIAKFRSLQDQWKRQRDQKPASTRQGQPGQHPQAQLPTPSSQQPQQPQQQPQRQPSQPNMPPQQAVKEEPQIKIEGPPLRYNMMQGNPQQMQQPPPQNMQMPPALAQQQQNHPPPAQHPQTMPPNQAQQYAQPGQPQHAQQNRPQINPHQANAHQYQQNSPHPQSATSTAPGAPVPLTHHAAVSAANRSYTDPQRTMTPMQQQPGAGSNFGNREREQMNNPKMPIPRHLSVTTPAPVHMGQSRPTMSGPTNGAPGPMGMPAVPRPPPFQLEGEGDRVLSKRKLDELVRQITGGAEEVLTPEVEEVRPDPISTISQILTLSQSVLQLADDFVDNVISTACKLSKLRESPQLDIRDIQLVLERNYNIRIPGYASDEVRTVRKVVPASGWVDKMKAVNAAKVMGGKADF